MYPTTARGAAAYRNTSVQSSSPVELVVLLYDGAVRHLTAARDAIDRKDIAGRAAGISTAMAIVAELQSTLNLEQGGEIAASLDNLYVYITGRLLDATLRQDYTGIDEATRLLKPLRDGWAQIAAGTPAPGPRP